MLPGAINATENCARCSEGFATMSGEVNVRFIALFSCFHRAKGPLCGRQVGSSHLKYHLNLEAWVIPGEMNATENCARCNEGLAAMSGEVDV